jgi:hypothetical protein
MMDQYDEISYLAMKYIGIIQTEQKFLGKLRAENYPL